MRVNVELLLRMRKDKAWSQEELAIAAGLNLRTIQRIEKDATASLQSMKALASAFAVNIRDLEHEEATMLSELVGKDVWIVMGITVIDPRFNDSLKGRVVEVSDSWLKLAQKDKSIYINISQIKRIIPE